ncbi:MAG: hypothetical protein AAEJ52_03490, partial [Myxococcota bacterium]
MKSHHRSIHRPIHSQSVRSRSRLRCWLGAGTLAWIALLGPACERATPSERIALELAARGPVNIVLIVVDTLRSDWITPYGADSRISP